MCNPAFTFLPTKLVHRFRGDKLGGPMSNDILCAGKFPGCVGNLVQFRAREPPENKLSICSFITPLTKHGKYTLSLESQVTKNNLKSWPSTTSLRDPSLAVEWTTYREVAANLPENFDSRLYWSINCVTFPGSERHGSKSTSAPGPSSASAGTKAAPAVDPESEDLVLSNLALWEWDKLMG